MFSDKEVLDKFLTLPASCNNHHQEAGGLCAHSLEVAKLIGKNEFESKYLRELTMVAGFLHDIGKIKTISGVGQLSTLGFQVSHECLNYEICGVALKQLEKDCKMGADFLRHVWSCSSFGAHYGYQPNSDLALIVKQADQLSVHRDLQRQAFENSKAFDGIYFHQNRRYQKTNHLPKIF